MAGSDRAAVLEHLVAAEGLIATVRDLMPSGGGPWTRRLRLPPERVAEISLAVDLEDGADAGDCLPALVGALQARAAAHLDTAVSQLRRHARGEGVADGPAAVLRDGRVVALQLPWERDEAVDDLRVKDVWAMDVIACDIPPGEGLAEVGRWLEAAVESADAIDTGHRRLLLGPDLAPGTAVAGVAPI